MEHPKKEDGFIEKAEEKIDEFKLAYKEYRHDLVSYTQKNPVRALALAAGVGVFLGVAWKAITGKKM